MRNSILNRINSIEKAVSSKPMIPKAICKMTDNTIKEIYGMDVLQPMLNNEIVEAICDDADIANLLRAMDIDRKVTIETYMIVNGKPVRQYI